MFSESAEDTGNPGGSDGGVNYDCVALVEVAVEGLEYRLDAGKQGTALCISTREAGSWDWSYCGEARWDGRDLRAKPFDRAVLVQLSAALREAIQDMEG